MSIIKHRRGSAFDKSFLHAVQGLKKLNPGKSWKRQFAAAGLALACAVMTDGTALAYPHSVSYDAETETFTLYNTGIISNSSGDIHGVGHAMWDYTSWDVPEKNLVISWDAQRSGERGPISNANVTAKSLTINSTSGVDQWSNKGIFADMGAGNPFTEVTIKVTEDINITSGHYTIFTDPGKINITGFKNLTARSASTAENSGFVVSNVTVGNNSSAINIVGTDDSTITLVSDKSNNPSNLRSVVEDASTEGTLIKGGTVNIYRVADEDYPIVEINYHLDPETSLGGSIDIEGNGSVTIGSATNTYAVQSLAKSTGTSNIWINKSSSGTVTINGNIVAESGTVTVNYAGAGSVQSGDVIAQNYTGASNSGSVVLTYSGADSVMNGDITASDTASVSTVFSGSNSSMTGDISADVASTVTAEFSGKNTSLNGSITAGDSSTVTAGFSGTNASMTGDITAVDSSTVTADFSGENSSLTGSITAGDSSTVTAEFSGTSASMTGDITTADSSTVTAAFSGENSSLTGNITTTGGTTTAQFTGSGSTWTGDLETSGGTSNIVLTSSAVWNGNLNATGGTTTVALSGSSTWNGAAVTASSAESTVDIASGSTWNVTADSSITNLILASGGTISMEGAASNLSIGNFSASEAVSGTLRMDLVYHDNNISTYQNASDSDFLYITSGIGATLLIEPTSSSTLNTMSDGDRLYFAQTGIDSTAFEVNQEILVMNSSKLYDKDLIVKNDQNTSLEGYEDWYLTTSDSYTDGDRMNPNGLIPTSAYTAALAIWRDSDTLLKRLGELRYNQEDQGTWVRYSRRKLEKDHTHTFSSKLNALQVGYDTKRTEEKGDWYYGAAIEHVWGDTDYDYGFGYGSGDSKMTDLTLYGTNIRSKGHYLDLTARIGRLDTDYDVSYGGGGDSGDFDNWAFSIGAEYGRKSGLGSGWYWEWQTQLTYSYVWGDSYTTANGAQISQDNFDSLVGRLGLVLSREFGTDTAKPGRVYVKASLQHEFLGDSSERLYDDIFFYDSEDLDDTWYTVGLGANVKLSGNCDLYLDAERDFDADIKNKYRFECGVRFEF
jgi:outer membrane autotransporter protein